MDQAYASRARLRMTFMAILVVALLSGTSAMADDDDRPASDDIAEFESIAEQELTLGEDELVWQASELPAFVDEGRPIPFFAGFIYALDVPLVVYRDGGQFTRLAAEKAMPIEDGARLAPVAPRDDDATFLALELVAEDEAFEPAGDRFRPEAGDYVLELLRAEYDGTDDEGTQDEAAPVGEDEDEPATLEVAEAPVLLFVVAGEIELTLEGEAPEHLEAGDVATVDEEFELRWRGEEPGVLLAAMLRLPEEKDDAEGDGEDGSGAARAATTPAGSAGPGGSASGGADDTAPTPTPEPTEEPDGSSGGTLPPGEPPPDDTPSDPGGTSGSGDGLYEEGPGDGECLYCAPADDDLFEEGATSDPCLLADGGGDPDFDELNNCGEAAAGTFPYVQDTDGDGAWDGFEVRTGTNPTRPDTDGDGLDDWDEFTYSTNPLTPDTDGDGVSDTQELFTYGTKPTIVDTDGDCLWDGDEIFSYGTNPGLKDSDGDTFSDLIEINLGYNPLDGGSHPDEEVVAETGC
jgi:hypothetical protein